MADKFTLKFEKKDLHVVDLERGLYSFCELKDYVDWEVKRVYFIQRTKETGQHCHFKENELFIMVKGSCTAIIDSGEGKKDVVMNGPGDAIYIGNHVWHGFKDFSEDAVLLALSSTNYSPDRSDYCEDYEEYKKIIEEIQK